MTTVGRVSPARSVLVHFRPTSVQSVVMLLLCARLRRPAVQQLSGIKLASSAPRRCRYQQGTAIAQCCWGSQVLACDATLLTPCHAVLSAGRAAAICRLQPHIWSSLQATSCDGMLQFMQEPILRHADMLLKLSAASCLHQPLSHPQWLSAAGPATGASLVAQTHNWWSLSRNAGQ